VILMHVPAVVEVVIYEVQLGLLWSRMLARYQASYVMLVGWVELVPCSTLLIDHFHACL
jgi:hypothetical protein